MNVLIIGGSGFIGSSYASFIKSRGHDVVTISKNSDAVGNINHYRLSDTDWPSIVRQLKDRMDWHVIDLAYASVPNTSFADPIKDFSENLYMVNEHLKFLEQISVRRYVYISSGGTVYGDGEIVPIPETASNFPLSPYGITKLAAERYVYMHHKLFGFNTVIVRPSNIYGIGQKPFRGQGFIATALGLILRGGDVKIFGDGRQIRDYLYVDDFCAALEKIMLSGQPGEIYNVGHGDGLSLVDLLEQIENVVAVEGYKINRVFEPKRPFDVENNVLDISKMRKALCWEPAVSIEEGVSLTWRWLKAQNFQL